MAIAYTSSVAGYDYGFDFVDQYIYVDATLGQINIEDLYTAIKDAQASVAGVVDKPIASGSGLDELDPGIATFLTVRVFDEWEIRSLKVSGKVTTTGGNIVKDNGKDPFYDDGSIFYIAFFSQAGIKTTVATGSGLDAPQAAQLALAAEAAQVNTKVGTPTVSVSDDIAEVKAAVDLTATQDSVDVLPTAVENADALLPRNLAGGSDGGRTVQDALRANRNKVVVDAVAGTITVYKEDDVTVAWAGVITTSVRDPISEVDPT